MKIKFLEHGQQKGHQEYLTENNVNIPSNERWSSVSR